MRFKKGMEDFNFTETAADKISVGDFLSLIETLPLLSEKRLVFCDRAESFQDKDWKQIQDFLPSGKGSNGESDLVLAFFFKKQDKRKKHFKILQERGAVELSALPVKDWELAPWLEFLAQKEGIRVLSSEGKLLLQLTGPSLLNIQMELKKLKQYMGERLELREEDILACVSRRREDSVFDLSGAIGQKDLPRALYFLAQLLDQSQNAIGALMMVARHIRILSRLKEGEGLKLNSKALAQKAAVPPYFLKNYLGQSRAWTRAQIRQALLCLYETDKALKSSPLPSHFHLKAFILKVCA